MKPELQFIHVVLDIYYKQLDSVEVTGVNIFEVYYVDSYI